MFCFGTKYRAKYTGCREEKLRNCEENKLWYSLTLKVGKGLRCAETGKSLAPSGVSLGPSTNTVSLLKTCG